MDIEIILTGSFGVGKSSIFNRFIYNEFSNKYYGTLGVRINEKQLTINDTIFNFKVWDVAGEVDQTKVPKSYFYSPSVILYVIDLNRSFAIKNVPNDIDYLKTVAKDKTIIIVGNKKDLIDEAALNGLLQTYGINFHCLTSAKTGENIDTLFESIAIQELKKHTTDQ